MKKICLLLGFMVLETVILSGCISNNALVKQPKFEYQIEGYNISFLFDTAGYQISKENTTYGESGLFKEDYYENGINISSKDSSKGIEVKIRKYVETQNTDLNDSEGSLRLGLAFGAIQGVQFNRSIVDGHEALILFTPTQEFMGKKIPTTWYTQYYLDDKTTLSFTTYGLTKSDFEMIRNSFNAIPGSDLYTIKVISTGEWRGSISAGNSFKSESGLGDKTFTIHGSPLTATFKKDDKNSTLKVEVWNGDVLKESDNTTEPYGTVKIGRIA